VLTDSFGKDPGYSGNAKEKLKQTNKKSESVLIMFLNLALACWVYNIFPVDFL